MRRRKWLRVPARARCCFDRLSAPAKDHDLLWMETISPLGKWAAGVGGVTLAVVLSFAGSTYTSFIQVYDKCPTRLIASDAILAARVWALWALIGAAIALSGLALPRIAKLTWHGFGYGSRDGWQPAVFTSYAHTILIGLGAAAVASVPLAALSVAARQTPDGLTRYVRQIDARCANAPKKDVGAGSDTR